MLRGRRLVALVLVLSVFALSNASCVGDFALTNKLLKWNQGLNKWLGSFVLLIFIIIPVYGVTLLIDWIILNVIQFYGGNNPISLNGEPVTKEAAFGDTRVAMTMRPGAALDVDIVSTDTNGVTRTLIVRETEDGRLDARLVENHAVTSRLSAYLADDGAVVRSVDGKSEHFDDSEVREVVEGSQGMTRFAFASAY